MTTEEYTVAYESYYLRMVSHMQSLCFDRDLAEDIVQTAWLNAWRFREQYQGQASIYSWVTCIARNAWLNHVRRSSIKRELVTGQVPEMTMTVDLDSRLDAEAALAFCPEACRDLLVMSAQGYSEVAIAALKRLTLPAAKKRMHKARLLVRKRLAA